MASLMKVNRISVVAILLLIAASLVAQTAPPSNPPVYLDPSQPIDVRVDDLISRMTLEEKASQVVNQARAIPRLQVPAYDWWSEALHGVANAGTATVFPEPIGLAATFDPPLIHNMAVVISIEARAKHNQAVRAGHSNVMEGLDFWSPNINIFRDPRWGRGQETYGEDPFLTGRMGVAFVTGMQGDDPKYFRVISTPKHFAVHSGPEPSRHTIDVPVSKHDMEDTYLPAFRATVTEGKAESVMCAYNRVNGQPACANTFLLQDQLRGAWKFNGYVVSDCDAIVDIFQWTSLHQEPRRSRRRRHENRHGQRVCRLFHQGHHQLRLRKISGRREAGPAHRKRSSTSHSSACSPRACAWACSILPRWCRMPAPRTRKSTAIPTANWRCKRRVNPSCC